MLARTLAVDLRLSPRGRVGPARKSAVVDHVVDGDTIEVEYQGHTEDVYIGVDTRARKAVRAPKPDATRALPRAVAGPADRAEAGLGETST